VTAIVFRGGIELESPLEMAVGFLEAYPESGMRDASGPESFDERDLRSANRGGARIAAVESAAILARRDEIEHSLRRIPMDASLAAATSAVPWEPLTRLFCAFADIRGVGFSKMTKALHAKRPALIPMLDSVVQAYLTADGPERRSPQPFGQRATALVRSYKQDLDANASALEEIQRALVNRGYQLTEVRILDLLIWSAYSQSAR